MEEILQSLQMGNLVNRFHEQRMEPPAVLAASDSELSGLGVTTIGERIRIRDACKKKLDETEPSTSRTNDILQERLSLFNPRRSNSRNSTRAASRNATGNIRKRSLSKSHPWTPTFVCLAEHLARKAPSSLDKEILFKAGLGVKKEKTRYGR